MLKVTQLKKSYRKPEVLKGVNFEVSPGRIYSIIGNNGAGKTTTIKCIMGFLQRNDGSIKIDNVDPADDLKAALRKTGYVPQKLSLPADLKVEEVLNFTADVRYVSREKSIELLKEFDLFEDRFKRVRELSGGMLQRLGIVLALLSSPELLIMDEPMLNLDPHWQERLKVKLRELRKQNTAILLSIHNLKDAEEISDTIGVISNGIIVKEGSGRELRSGVSVTSRMRIFSDANVSKAYEVLKNNGFNPLIKDTWIDIGVVPHEKTKVIEILRDNNIVIKDFFIEDIPLEEIIKEV